MPQSKAGHNTTLSLFMKCVDRVPVVCVDRSPSNDMPSKSETKAFTKKKIETFRLQYTNETFLQLSLRVLLPALACAWKFRLLLFLTTGPDAIVYNLHAG